MIPNILVLIIVAATAFALPHHGTTRTTDDSRIVNGTDVPEGKYPFMVAFEAYGAHACGASIINENWALTAAHCVYYKKLESVALTSGTVTLNSGGLRHEILQMLIHEEYNPNNIFNDIAVIQVNPPFEWNADTQPVTLPAQGQDTPGGSNATVVGWGYPYSEGYIMNHLQEVDYWVVSDEECMEVHKYEVFPTNICAYYPGGGKGQCSGDSGGPLLVNGYQAGIVSWSEKPCTIAPYPGVFTEVSPYVDWIHSKTN